MKKLVSLVLTFSLLSQTLLIPTSSSVAFSAFAAPLSGAKEAAKEDSTLNPPPSILNYQYQYDATGNLIDDNLRTISYDASGMPSSITKGDTVVNFIYDGSGQRIGKIVKVNGKLQSSTIYFGNIEKEMAYNDAGQVTSTTITKYYFAGGKKIALRKQAADKPDELIFTHPDHLSSSTLFTDDAGGKKDSLLTYYPYGTERQNWDIPSSTFYLPPSNHLYTDQIKDPETDLYYYNARYYNQQTGLFISPDTTGDKLNRYAYASNNPIMFNDPSGHKEYKEEKDPLEPKGNPPNPPPIPFEDFYLNPAFEPLVKVYLEILESYKSSNGYAMSDFDALNLLSKLMNQKLQYSSRLKNIKSGDVLLGNQQISLSDLTDLNKQEKIQKKLLNSFWNQYKNASLEEKYFKDMMVCADFTELFADIAYNTLGVSSSPFYVLTAEKTSAHAVVGIILYNQPYIIDPTVGSNPMSLSYVLEVYPNYDWKTLTPFRGQYTTVGAYWERRGGGITDFSIFSVNYISLKK